MPNHRITLSVLILAIALILVLLHRISRRDDDGIPQAASLRPSPPHQIETARTIRPAKSGPRHESRSSLRQQVIATTGTQVILDVYADRTFLLHLPDRTKDIFVVQGKDLFATWDGVPRGVKIMIRNGAGQVLTPVSSMGMQISGISAESGWHGWEPNHIEMPVFRSRLVTPGEPVDIPIPPDAIELVPRTSSARMSPRVKLADMARAFSLATREVADLEGLQFKLAFFPGQSGNARGPDGTRLTNDVYPWHETEWLDGGLLLAVE